MKNNSINRFLIENDYNQCINEMEVFFKIIFRKILIVNNQNVMNIIIFLIICIFYY